MAYKHVMADGSACDLPVGKVVCVGRNYADHAKELNNPVPTEPILFIKPTTAVVPLVPSFSIPAGRGECHHETEIALLIGKQLSHADAKDVRSAIVGVGIGLDLTLRDLQAKLKEKGHPWELAKSFDGACPLSPFVAVAEFSDFADLSVSLSVNGERRQQGNSAHMLFPILELVALISQTFTLTPGDVVLTGTPSGVAPLKPQDQLEVMLDNRYAFETKVLPS